jgi:glycosyltransferase involved in cell wall biosynthesis
MLDRVHRLCGRAAAAAWARADAAVLYDGQGIGLAGTAQAVAAGVPIIAAAGGELAATLTHDRTALLAAPGKALMLARALWRLVRDADLGPRLARQARTELEPLTDVQAWLGAMESVYRRLGA